MKVTTLTCLFSALFIICIANLKDSSAQEQNLDLNFKNLGISDMQNEGMIAFLSEKEEGKTITPLESCELVNRCHYRDHPAVNLIIELLFDIARMELNHDNSDKYLAAKNTLDYLEKETEYLIQGKEKLSQEIERYKNCRRLRDIALLKIIEYLSTMPGTKTTISQNQKKTLEDLINACYAAPDIIIDPPDSSEDQLAPDTAQVPESDLG